MKHQETRREKRVRVNLPISLSVEDKDQVLSTRGRVEDISINGMQVEVPLPFGMLEEKELDFDLELPEPFSKIRGRGQVQWKRWNDENSSMACGLKLEPLTLKQLMDLDIIVTEALEELS